jgi:hypothetical protein
MRRAALRVERPFDITGELAERDERMRARRLA